VGVGSLWPEGSAAVSFFLFEVVEGEGFFLFLSLVPNLQYLQIKIC
jgi:hypothetical protein